MATTTETRPFKLIGGRVYVPAICLYDHRTPTETACGRPGKAMSWMEFKRGRITCPLCYDSEWGKRARAELRELCAHIVEPGTGF